MRLHEYVVRAPIRDVHDVRWSGRFGPATKRGIVLAIASEAAAASNPESAVGGGVSPGSCGLHPASKAAAMLIVSARSG